MRIISAFFHEHSTENLVASKQGRPRSSADLILVMQHGDIVEQGTHDQLIEKGGFYADLYNSQFEDVVE